MKGGIGQLMKQAQQMQEKMKQAQDELANITVVGESGGGMVSITMPCKNEIKKIKIDEVLFNEEKDMLEDLLIAAFNDAARRAEKKTQESMSGMTLSLIHI